MSQVVADGEQQEPVTQYFTHAYKRTFGQLDRSSAYNMSLRIADVSCLKAVDNIADILAIEANHSAA